MQVEFPGDEVQIDCPKCSQVLVVRNDSGTTQPLPKAPVVVPVGSTQPVTHAPAPVAAAPPVVAPIAPIQTPPPIQPPPPPPPPAPSRLSVNPHHRQQAQRRQANDRSKQLWTVVGIAVTSLLVLGTIGGAVVYSNMPAKHQGWETVTFSGYDLQLPPGDDSRFTEDDENAGNVEQRITGVRSESGSQYVLTVIYNQSLRADAYELETLIARIGLVISNQKEMIRKGRRSIAGTVESGPDLMQGCEVEVFRDGKQLVVAAYMPYSIIRTRIREADPPQANERELDRPDEFFASISKS